MGELRFEVHEATTLFALLGEFHQPGALVTNFHPVFGNIVCRVILN